MRSYTIKENNIGSAVSVNLSYTQTDTLLLFYKNTKWNVKLNIWYINGTSSINIFKEKEAYSWTLSLKMFLYCWRNIPC